MRRPRGKCNQGLFFMQEQDVVFVMPSDSFYETIFDDRQKANYETGFWMLNCFPIR